MAYEVFVNAVASKYLDYGRVIPSLMQSHNSAGKKYALAFRKSCFGICSQWPFSYMYITHVDMIMDMLGQPKLRLIITESYQTSDEPKRVRDEITEVRYDTKE